MSRYNAYCAFDKTWFIRHQDRLLRIINGKATGNIARRLLHIDNDNLILRILPNSITWATGNKDEYKIDFRTHAKYSKRVYFALEPIWWMMHAWDWAIADRYVPQLSFGFDTLTAYPDTTPGTTSCNASLDTYAQFGVASWATHHDATSANTVNRTSGELRLWINNQGSGNFYAIGRAIMLFDTSDLTSSANVSAATLSLYEKAGADTLSLSANIYTSTPASNTAIVGDDYDQCGTVAQSDSPMTFATFYSSSAYKDWAFNSTGVGNVSKTGISKFSWRITADAANSAPPGETPADNYIDAHSSDQTGTANDPKLVVTYTAGYTPGSLVGKIPTFLQL